MKTKRDNEGVKYGGESVPLFTNIFNGKTGVLNGNFKLNECFKTEFYLNGCFKPEFDCVSVYLRKHFTGILFNDSKAN